MAKTVTTTDDKVQEAAKKWPKAEGMLKELFPDAFPVEFKAGDIVDFTHGHKSGPFVVVSANVKLLLEDAYDSCREIRVISLRDGVDYAGSACGFKKVNIKHYHF